MYIVLYLCVIVFANYLVLWFGPEVTIINAFLLIGFDLTLRDKLHDKWHNNHLVLKMFLLICAGSLITFLLNRDSGSIAMASVIAFSVAAVADTVIYAIFRKSSFLKRANYSNIGGALADSILFPSIAFGMFLPWIIIGQFLAKLAGGFVWSLLLNRLRSEEVLA